MATKSKRSSTTIDATKPAKFRHRTRPVPPPEPSIPPDQDDADYEVGYRRPPAATRFKRGQSGNPRGRPKKKEPPSFNNLLQETLNEAVRVTEGGKPKKYTLQELSLKSTAAKAAKGDLRAMTLVQKMVKDHPPKPPPPTETQILPQSDQEILDRYIERRIAALKKKGERK